MRAGRHETLEVFVCCDQEAHRHACTVSKHRFGHQRRFQARRRVVPGEALPEWLSLCFPGTGLCGVLEGKSLEERASLLGGSLGTHEV